MLEFNNKPINKRFEVKSNDLDPSEQATYVHKYMATHISPIDIKEKKLSATPVSSNIKDSQKLDEYIKELLTENKKYNMLNQEKYYGIRKKCYSRKRIK